MTTLSPGPALKSTAASHLGDLAPSSRRRSGSDGDMPLNSERSFGDEISSALAQTSAGREPVPTPANDPASASTSSTPSDVGSLPSAPLAGQTFLPAFGLSAPTTPVTLGASGDAEAVGLDGSTSSSIASATPGGAAVLGTGVGPLLSQTEAALDLTGPPAAVGGALLGAPLGTQLETAPETTLTAAGALHPQPAESGAASASGVTEAADPLGRTAFSTDLGAGSEGSQHRPDSTSQRPPSSTSSSALSAPETSPAASPSDPAKTPGTGPAQATQPAQGTLPASKPEPSLPAAAATPASTTALGLGDAALSPTAPTAPTTSAVTPVTSPSAVPPAPPTTNSATEVRPAVVAAQVAAEISRFTATATPGTHRISIALSPEALGDVRVTLVVRSGNLQVHLAAETAAARAALTSGSPELARLLESVGAPDARVVVRDMSGASAERSPAQSFNGHPGADQGPAGGSREAPDHADRDRSGSPRHDRLNSDPTLDRAAHPTDLAAARPATAGGSHLDQLI